MSKSPPRERPEELLKSRQPPDNHVIARRVGLTREINITNSCDKNAYVIVSSTPIKSITSLGLDGIGNVEFETQGEYKSQELLILPGYKKLFDLHTKEVYLSILIEVENSVWKQWRKNRLINAGRCDYQITPIAVSECVDRNFLDYSRK